MDATLVCASKEKAASCKHKICRRCSFAMSPEAAKAARKTEKYNLRISKRAKK
jgi:ribosomal protein L40E